MSANPKANSHVGYNTDQFGTFEVFWHDKAMPGWNDWPHGGEGWYWWSCSPGCLPDGDPSGPSGPFDTSLEAWEDATPYSATNRL